MIQKSDLLENKTYNSLIIVILFLINLSFKLINLTYEPIWYDECFSIFYSQGTVDDILFVSTWDINPPFFNLFLHPWVKFFGTSELSMRMVPAILSSLTGVALYLFLKKYINVRTAITASVLYLFSNISFYYAHEVRGYTLILFVSILSIWLFIKMLEKPGYIASVALGLTYYILIMTHYLTFFILLAQGILFLIFFNRTLLKFYLIAVASFTLLFWHWMPRVVEIISGGSKHWLKSPDLNNLFDFIFSISNGKLQLIILCVLACTGIIAIIIKKEQFFHNKVIKAIVIYSILISFVTVLLNYIISSTIPIFLDRYLLFSLPGFIILYAVFISRIPLNNFFYYSLLTFVGIYAFSQVSINGPTTKMDYRSAVNYVKYEQDSASVVFIQTIDVGALFTYYYDKEIFKNYSNIENLLKEKMVFMGNDSTKVPSFNDSLYTKIIHVETFSEFSDPNKTVIAWFDKNNYVKTKVKEDYVGVKVTTYQKK
jgi:mannosyltransferase